MDTRTVVLEGIEDTVLRQVIKGRGCFSIITDWVLGPTTKETCFTSVTTKLSVSEFKKQHLIQKAPPLYIRIFHNAICLNIHEHTTTLRCWKDICYDELYTKDNTLDIGEYVTHTTRGSCCRLFRRLLSSFWFVVIWFYKQFEWSCNAKIHELP